MAGIVEPEELAALARAAGAGGDGAHQRVAAVVPRDFTEPRTLSADRIARIRKTLSARLQTIANALAGPLRGHPTLTLGEVGEVNAQGLFDGFTRPFLVHGFQCSDQQGWIIWDTAAARIVSDAILSGALDDEPEEDPDDEDEDGEPVVRPEPEPGNPVLTRTERRVVSSFLDDILSRIATKFGLDAQKGAIWQETEELTTLEDLGPDADSRRLFIHLGFEDESGETSDIRIYLPGIAAAEDEDGAEDGADDSAPIHLAPIDMVASVLLGGTDVPLAELLEIEVGDVIPLDARLGDRVRLEIEETVCAQGRFGARGGLLCVLVEKVGAAPPPTTQQQ